MRAYDPVAQANARAVVGGNRNVTLVDSAETASMGLMSSPLLRSGSNPQPKFQPTRAHAEGQSRF